MKKYLKSLVILSPLLLASCVNQNTKITENLMPTTNACTKLELLQKAYYDDFSSLKGMKLTSHNMWKAKYNLFGNSCQIFSWGNQQHTYSCSLMAPDEKTAKEYYQNAKTVTQQCLGTDWQQEESDRRNDDGLKTTFGNSVKDDDKFTISTHLVPTSSLFSTKWTIYYYVGNMKKAN